MSRRALGDQFQQLRLPLGLTKKARKSTPKSPYREIHPDFEIAHNTTPKKFEGILNKGAISSGYTPGVSNYKMGQGRTNAEKFHFGYADDYAGPRPVYGTLVPTDHESNSPRYEIGDMYGNVRLSLKVPRSTKVTTTPADSEMMVHRVQHIGDRDSYGHGVINSAERFVSAVTGKPATQPLRKNTTPADINRKWFAPLNSSRGNTYEPSEKHEVQIHGDVPVGNISRATIKTKLVDGRIPDEDRGVLSLARAQGIPAKAIAEFREPNLVDYMPEAFGDASTESGWSRLREFQRANARDTRWVNAEHLEQLPRGGA